MIDFPLFERDEETGNWTFLHHPFTAPIAGHEERVAGDPGSALSQHYDLIWNGWELGGRLDPDPRAGHPGRRVRDASG